MSKQPLFPHVPKRSNSSNTSTDDMIIIRTERGTKRLFMSLKSRGAGEIIFDPQYPPFAQLSNLLTPSEKESLRQHRRVEIYPNDMRFRVLIDENFPGYPFSPTEHHRDPRTGRYYS